MHQNIIRKPAVLDASFWVNLARSGLLPYLNDYFILHAPPKVVEELSVLLTVVNPPEPVVRFDEWLKAGRVQFTAPQGTFARFDAGENEVTALARERGWVLLIDNHEPRDYSRGPLALTVVDSPAFAVFLFDQGRVSEQEAATALARSHAARRVVREALVLLTELTRRKGGANK
ncbi:MAG TPA: hypothetical protein VFZ25_09780 [Chloroflexota bacterium]|nr:hypothetical protein [Chloroflexota bacterium]